MKHATAIAIEGAVLICPECKARIGVLRNSLYQGWTFGLDAISFVEGQQPANNQAQCRCCGASYAEWDRRFKNGKEVRTMLVHTDRGWLPKPPPNAPAPPRAPLKPAA